MVLGVVVSQCVMRRFEDHVAIPAVLIVVALIGGLAYATVTRASCSRKMCPEGLQPAMDRFGTTCLCIQEAQ